MFSTFHHYNGRYYATYLGRENDFRITKLEEIKRTSWDCDPWMYFKKHTLEHRMQYHSELNKKFVVTDKMEIEEFCLSPLDVTCVLWHKDSFFTI